MKLSASFVFLLAIALSGCDPKDSPEKSSSLNAVEALIAKNEIDPAIALLEKMRAEDSSNPKVTVRLAELYSSKNDLSKAVILYREVLDRNPVESNPKIRLVYIPLGQIYRGLHQYPQAKECFEKARALGVEDAKVSLPLAICLAQLGDLDNADQEFERALKAGETENVIRFNQALVREEKKQFTEARALLEGILATDPTHAGAKRELAHVLQVMAPPDKATLQRSMDLLWEVKDELKNDPRMYEFMGDGWLLAGDFDASLEAYTEALRLGQNPKSVEEKYVIAKRRQMDAAKDKAGSDEKPVKPAVKPK